jgi:type IV fimbrial biogenesis protein FimT
MTLRRAARGFTLIELMVTLTILAIMLGLGVPAFRNFTDGQKVKSASYELSTSFAIARSEAIKRNTSVTIAPVTSGSWASGWTVKAGTANTLVHEQGSFPLLTISRLPSGAPANVVFQATGRPDPASSSASRSYFQINGSASVRCITLDAVGIPSTSSTSCPTS